MAIEFKATLIVTEIRGGYKVTINPDGDRPAVEGYCQRQNQISTRIKDVASQFSEIGGHREQ